MESKIKTLCDKFNIKGQFVSCKSFTSGHINTTCLVEFNDNGKSKKFVLQRINKHVFKNPSEVMDNIVRVTGFVKSKIVKEGRNPKGRVLEFLPSDNGKYYVVDDNGDYWRMYKFVDNSVTFDSTDNMKILEESGKAFGKFQYYLSDYPIKKLNIIIPHFHNTENRYQIFKNTVAKNPVGRAKAVLREIKDFLMLEEIATRMYRMQKNNELKLRVTHNDTKCNNVLYDAKTGKYLCVIDLDTVMPGLIGFDYGDAIRFGANTSAEDETNLEKVKIDMKKFEAYTKGFLSEVAGSITLKEKDTLALGAITMTLECGLRFLTDYIDGDNYFKTNYPEHNLDRAKCQLALAKDMMKNYRQMKCVIDDIYDEEIKKRINLRITV